MHGTITEFLEKMAADGRTGSAESYELALRKYSEWLDRQHIDALTVTTDTIQAFQRWLAEDYVKDDGESLKRSTQLTRLTPVLAFYRYAERRGLVLANPGKGVKLPRVPRRNTPKDYLDLQEATALVQTQARRVLSYTEGTFKWAEMHRNLAMICLVLCTGRRRQGLLSLRVKDLDTARCELRVEWEKSRAGRVVPVAKWAMDVCKIYLEKARSRVLGEREDKGWLFPGTIGDKMAGFSFVGILRKLKQRTVDENPDLETLSTKHLTPHGLRVSFATLLFKGGCNIRSINELMLHSSLSTTARYTPIPLEDLRRACRLAHPRA